MEARVNPSLARELADILSGSTPRNELASEGPLLVAARMLSHAADYEMTATTVVGVLGRDDVDVLKLARMRWRGHDSERVGLTARRPIRLCA